MKIILWPIYVSLPFSVEEIGELNLYDVILPQALPLPRMQFVVHRAAAFEHRPRNSAGHRSIFQATLAEELLVIFMSINQKRHGLAVDC
jgi:hypothetical protein